jgi:toluene monooxygenase system protein E
LSAARQVPSEYELVTSKLLWYPGRGFEVDVPLADWYARHQSGSALTVPDWDRFVDPLELTYSKYVAIRRARETVFDGLLRMIDHHAIDRELPAEWPSALARVLPVMRFPVHAMQMIAAYIGQMAPGGRIVVACALQAADELRRIHRVVERTAQLRRTYAGFGTDARQLWEHEAAWQPLRETVEHALVSWDWGEAFVALNLCIAPLLDDAIMVRFADVARRRGDSLLRVLLASLNEDCLWHRSWAGALVATALAERPANRDALEIWLARWAPKARRAIVALDRLVAPDAIAEGAISTHASFIASLGLRMP